MLKQKLLVAAAMATLTSSTAFAHLVDSSGKSVMDGAGDCVTTGNPMATPCGGAPAPKTTVLSASALFDTNSSIVKPAGKAELTALAAQAAKAKSVTVVGHTDSRGSDAYNQKLSERRAKAAAAVLSANGVDAGKITSYGRGESQPIADNGTKEGRAQNRRVEVTVN